MAQWRRPRPRPLRQKKSIEKYRWRTIGAGHPGEAKKPRHSNDPTLRHWKNCLMAQMAQMDSRHQIHRVVPLHHCAIGAIGVCAKQTTADSDVQCRAPRALGAPVAFQWRQGAVTAMARDGATPPHRVILHLRKNLASAHGAMAQACDVFATDRRPGRSGDVTIGFWTARPVCKTPCLGLVELRHRLRMPAWPGRCRTLN
jgi:hypothetical protein